MTRSLATPAAFGTLAVALAGWLLAWSIPPVDRGNTYINVDHIAHQPVLCLAKGKLDLSMTTGRYAPASYFSPWQGVVYEREGVLHTDESLATMLWNLPDGMKAAAGLETRFHTEDFGLLAPVVYRRVTDVSLLKVNSTTPLLDRAIAIEAGVQAQIIRPPNVETTISYRAAAHDLLFLVTLAAFARSALAVPSWPIWKHITPAQRRRMRDACAACSYDRTGLAADAPCPECGRN